MDAPRRDALLPRVASPPRSSILHSSFLRQSPCKHGISCISNYRRQRQICLLNFLAYYKLVLGRGNLRFTRRTRASSNFYLSCSFSSFYFVELSENLPFSETWPKRENASHSRLFASCQKLGIRFHKFAFPPRFLSLRRHRVSISYNLRAYTPTCRNYRNGRRFLSDWLIFLNSLAGCLP